MQKYKKSSISKKCDLKVKGVQPHWFFTKKIFNNIKSKQVQLV